jgi:hypothetical protein
VGSVRVAMNSDAAGFVQQRGGRLWVWAAYGHLCCAGSPAWMHAATEPPPGLSGFSPVVGGQVPDVLEIGLRGRRRPKVAAYWDGCLMAMV